MTHPSMRTQLIWTMSTVFFEATTRSGPVVGAGDRPMKQTGEVYSMVTFPIIPCCGEGFGIKLRPEVVTVAAVIGMGEKRIGLPVTVTARTAMRSGATLSMSLFMITNRLLIG